VEAKTHARIRGEDLGRAYRRRAWCLLLLAPGFVACAREEVRSRTEAAPVPATTPYALAALEARMPRPYRGRLEAAAALNDTCRSCHPTESEQWEGSRHHDADTNAAYREAFAIEPTPFCRGCHAPESDPRKEPSREVGELGVGCVTCHVTEEGSVLAAPSRRADDAAAGNHHTIHRSAEFARTGGCAACHEFAFPGPPAGDDGSFMQTTVREHARSPTAGKPCAACHMPVVEGARSHAFSQVRDPGWLRDHLQVTAERIGDHKIRIILSQTAPGHGFPTGDLFRRLQVGCEIRGTDGKAKGRDVRYLARHFPLGSGGHGRKLVRDDRVLFEPVTVELSPEPRLAALAERAETSGRGLGGGAPIATPGPIAWWVRYQRVAAVGAGTNEAAAKIESEVELYSGVVP
jgi:hypothetical protein